MRPVRLLFGALCAGVLAVGLVAFVHSRQHSTPNYTGGSPFAQPNPTKLYGSSVKLPADAQHLAKLFVRDAVLRQDTAAAKAMVSPSIRAGATDHQWAIGTIPVPQFPKQYFGGAAFKVLRSRQRDVLLDVQLGSTNAAQAKSLELLLEMKPVHGKWQIVAAAPPNSSPVPSA
jgi:hypothetical protein